MITRLHGRSHTPHDPLEEALARPLSPDESLPECTIVARWPGMDRFIADDEQRTWTSLQWADHVEEALLEHPFAASPCDDRAAILHLDVRLHPDDRDLTGLEWAEVAHRLARTAGIEIPGKESGCAWIAVQARPGRLDLIANLIHLDGAWHAPPTDVLRRLVDETCHIEQDLHLISPVRTGPTTRPALRMAPTASAQLADEQTGPLAAVRGLIEHTAHRFARQPEAAGTDTAHRLELLARRLLALQQDLHTTAAQVAQARIAAVPPSPPRSVHRSP
ncbi:relaxase/mobilization nuclease [Streptomyces halstedii]|uniref:relaxase/mobilization nuclease n=1 Tax=Streptomyces halstedii TaxID=1944 RepID=UPI00382B96FA